jgi:phosphomannomutase
MNFSFAFDVDGTLTLSRQKIDSDFAEWFLNWVKKHKVYIVTGSDYEKTVEQLGQEICDSVAGIFNCSGNAFYIKGELQSSNEFKLNDSQMEILNRYLSKSPFPLRTGNHFEQRQGMCNFSVVGRNATPEEREEYAKYDGQVTERQRMAVQFKNCFPEMDAVVGGDISVDIFPKGKDKSQIAQVLKPFIYFGDRTGPGGNDHEIAKLAEAHYSVQSWQETQRILTLLYNEEH